MERCPFNCWDMQLDCTCEWNSHRRSLPYWATDFVPEKWDWPPDQWAAYEPEHSTEADAMASECGYGQGDVGIKHDDGSESVVTEE